MFRSFTNKGELLSDYLDEYGFDGFSLKLNMKGGGGGSTEASDKMAEVTRQQWEDYKERFQPYEQRLLDELGSDERLNSNLSALQSDSAQNIKQYSAAEARNMSMYGVTKDDSESEQRRSALNIANQSNALRRSDEARKLNMMTTGIGSVKGQVM